jgi:molecular chaperone GrpE
MAEERRTNGELEEASGRTADQPAAQTGAAPDEASGAAGIEILQAEVARLTAEAERNWQQFLRAAADLENYRKQAARQRDEAVAATRRAMLGVILTVVDTLERALRHTEAEAHGDKAPAIADGIRLARRQVLDLLEKLGVRPMEAEGLTFDPRVHDAVEAVPANAGTAPGTIVGEVQRGYLMGDEVLRPARVRVAQ